MEQRFIDKCKITFGYQKKRTFTDEDVIKVLKRKGWQRIKEYTNGRLHVQWTRDDFWEACGEQICEKGFVDINNEYRFEFSWLQSDMSAKINVVAIF